ENGQVFIAFRFRNCHIKNPRIIGPVNGAFALKIKLIAGINHTDGSDLILDTFEDDRPVRKVVSEEIKPGPVRTQGCGTIKIFQGNTFPGTVNTGLISVNPRTQLPENIGLYLRDGAVGAGRNIEQQVAAVTDHIREDPDNLIGRLVGIVRRLISPAAVDGET